MRLKVCKKCGKTFQTENGHSANYLCPECYIKSKKDSVYRERICKICGEHFMGYPRSFFCPKCSEQRKKERNKKYKKSARPLGSIDYCEICGAEYIVKSGLQKYCPNCAEATIKANISAHKKSYHTQNKEHIQAYKKKMKSQGKVCIICGKTFDSNNSVTCSPECHNELKRIRQNTADIKRGKRKLPANEKYISDRPQSGIPGVTWRKNGKWQAVYKTHYIGVFDTINQAATAIDNYKKQIEEI